ncbi:hypothetical protein [Laceyella putida]|uniref:Uncharacterized protein n=1 Tax=Laceyella putida TaxID=110101 RepID=A0ABW2RRI4_9BACL
MIKRQTNEDCQHVCLFQEEGEPIVILMKNLIDVEINTGVRIITGLAKAE